MAVNPRLFELLAEAEAQPSRPYRDLQAALGAVRGIGEGYLQGEDIKAKLAERKRQQQTLSEALGGTVPSEVVGYGQIPVSTLKDLGGLDALAKFGKAGEEYLTPEQATQFGVDQPLIQSFGGKSIPRQVAQGYVSNKSREKIANAIEGRVAVQRANLQNAVLNTALRYSAAGMAQTAAKDSVGRLANINRAQQLLSQIDSQGGTATVRQRTELASAVGRSINPTGVLTNEALNLYIPNTLKGKVGNFMEYLGNASTPVDFTGFTGELGGLLEREKEVNQHLIKSATQFGEPATTQLRSINPGLAEMVSHADENPLLEDQTNQLDETDMAASQWLQDNPNAPEANAVRAKLQSKRGQRGIRP